MLVSQFELFGKKWYFSAPLQVRCKFCGREHAFDRKQCPAFGKRCHICGQNNHFAKMCESPKKRERDRHKNSDAQPQRQRPVYTVTVDSDTQLQSENISNVLDVHGQGSKSSCVMNVDASAIIVHPTVNNVVLAMEVDTGSAVSMIPVHVYESQFSNCQLQPSNKVFRSFAGESVPWKGMFRVHVQYKTDSVDMCWYVVPGSRHVLFGRDWLEAIRLDWAGIKFRPGSGSVCMSHQSELEGLVSKHQGLFDGKLGLLKGIKAHIEVIDGANPVYTKPYRVPYALRPKVEQELDRLEKAGVITPVTSSDWATGVVVVPKKNGAIRLCGNYKTTVNPHLKTVSPPNIHIDDILADLAGGAKFSKLDLANAYNQMEVCEDSRQYLTIATHNGLFQHNRLVYGITTAPAIWQNAIEKVLQGLPGVKVYLDDILVSGKTEAEHLKNLGRLFERLAEFGLKLNREKCEFSRDSLEYLGHVIDAHGIHKSADKIAVILDAPRPTDVSSLRSFIGMANYYRKFVPDFASTLHPLTRLLEKDRTFEWTDDMDDAFLAVKRSLCESGFLMHFDSSLPVTVACDASPVGVRAVLSHIMPNGEERPIQFASRALTKAEQNYAPVEREGLRIIFGVKRFYPFLFGRRFTLVTDNKPLAAIISPRKDIPAVAAERIQRWAMYLSGFNYEVRYRSSTQNANADWLSRLPTRNEAPGASIDEDVSLVLGVGVLPVTSEQIKVGVRKDPLLSQVMRYTRDGWPDRLPTDRLELQPYFSRRNELSLDGDVLLWGMRVIIPKQFRAEILDELHTGHIGVVKMKGVARSYVWWPGMDADIEACTKACESCQLVQRNPTNAPLHPWVPASRPGERIHIDYAGPVEGKMLLIVVDSFSKWPEVVIVNSTTSEATVNALRTMFNRVGVPQTLVSDNAPQFKSQEFKDFLDRLGVLHKPTPPYHPSSNGLAERFVQTVKQGMKAMAAAGESLQIRLDKFLLAYRNAQSVRMTVRGPSSGLIPTQSVIVESHGVRFR